MDPDDDTPGTDTVPFQTTPDHADWHHLCKSKYKLLDPEQKYITSQVFTLHVM